MLYFKFCFGYSTNAELPMATPIAMPIQGQSVEVCVLIEWCKSEGDTVAAGDILFSYETDKASFEFESPVAGTLLATFYDEGDDVPVLSNMAVIGDAGEDTESFAPAAAPAPAAPECEAATPPAAGRPSGGSAAPTCCAHKGSRQSRLSNREVNKSWVVACR